MRAFIIIIIIIIINNHSSAAVQWLIYFQVELHARKHIIGNYALTIKHCFMLQIICRLFVFSSHNSYFYHDHSCMVCVHLSWEKESLKISTYSDLITFILC